MGRGVLPDSASSRMSESILEDVSNSMASDQVVDPATAVASTSELSSSGLPAEDVRATESTFAEEGDADARKCEKAVEPKVAVTEEDEVKPPPDSIKKQPAGQSELPNSLVLLPP